MSCYHRRARRLMSLPLLLMVPVPVAIVRRISVSEFCIPRSTSVYVLFPSRTIHLCWLPLPPGMMRLGNRVTIA
jgi:hypothetical protein